MCSKGTGKGTASPPLLPSWLGHALLEAFYGAVPLGQLGRSLGHDCPSSEFIQADLGPELKGSRVRSHSFLLLSPTQ